MAEVDHLPSPIHDFFPDASKATSPGRPAAHEHKAEPSDTATVRSSSLTLETRRHRRHFIGGSDARIIMGDDEAALLRLWREKRGEAEPEDLSGNLIVQLGMVTEDLNRRWFEAKTGQVITDVQRHIRHPLCTGWERRSTAGWKQPGPFSRRNSCCRGRSRKKRRSKSMRHSCSITFGLSREGLRYFL